MCFSHTHLDLGCFLSPERSVIDINVTYQSHVHSKVFLKILHSLAHSFTYLCGAWWGMDICVCPLPWTLATDSSPLFMSSPVLVNNPLSPSTVA